MSDDEKIKRDVVEKSAGRVQIKMEDEIAKGKYANVAVLHNNDSEFVLDFIFMEPQRGQGRVVSRIISNPRTAKRLLAGLSELVANYEKRFGEIQLPPMPSPKGNYH